MAIGKNAQRWWDSLQVDVRTRLNVIIQESFLTQAATEAEEIGADRHSTSVTVAYDLAKAATDTTIEGSGANEAGRAGDFGAGLTLEQIESLAPKINKHTKTATDVGVKYQKFITKARSSYRDQYKNDPIQKFMSEDDYVKEVTKRYKEFGGEDQGTIIDNTLSAITSDFDAAVKAGTIDKETGEAADPDAVAAGNADLDAIFDKFDLDKTENKALYDSLAEAIKNDEIDLYGAELLIRQDPEFLEGEFQRQRDDLEPKLQKRLDDELALIDKENERLRGVQEEVFREDIAPVIRKEVGLLGGRDRDIHGNLLTDAAVELEKARQESASELRLMAELGDIERKRALDLGDFESLRNISNAPQALAAAGKLAEQKLRNINLASSLRFDKQNLLVQRASQREQREIAKVKKQLEQEEIARARAASKKAGRFGLATNIFAGIASGALAGAVGGPGGALVGGLAGGIAGYASGSSAAAGGFTLSATDYSNIGTLAETGYSAFRDRRND